MILYLHKHLSHGVYIRYTGINLGRKRWRQKQIAFRAISEQTRSGGNFSLPLLIHPDRYIFLFYPLEKNMRHPTAELSPTLSAPRHTLRSPFVDNKETA